MRDLTVKEVMEKKWCLEADITKYIRDKTQSFQDETGVPIKIIDISMDVIDTTSFNYQKKSCISRISDVDIELDFEAIE